MTDADADKSFEQIKEEVTTSTGWIMLPKDVRGPLEALLDRCALLEQVVVSVSERVAEVEDAIFEDEPDHESAAGGARE